MIPAKIIPQWRRTAMKVQYSGKSFTEAEIGFLKSMAHQITPPSQHQEDWLKNLAARARVGDG